jgi:hypothetical protein
VLLKITWFSSYGRHSGRFNLDSRLLAQLNHSIYCLSSTKGDEHQLKSKRKYSTPVLNYTRENNLPTQATQFLMVLFHHTKDSPLYQQLRINSTQYNETEQNEHWVMLIQWLSKTRAYSQAELCLVDTCKWFSVTSRLNLKFGRVVIKYNDSNCRSRSKHKTTATRHNRCNYKLDYTTIASTKSTTVQQYSTSLLMYGKTIYLCKATPGYPIDTNNYTKTIYPWKLLQDSPLIPRATHEHNAA